MVGPMIGRGAHIGADGRHVPPNGAPRSLVARFLSGLPRNTRRMLALQVESASWDATVGPQSLEFVAGNRHSRRLTAPNFAPFLSMSMLAIRSTSLWRCSPSGSSIFSLRISFGMTCALL
jgi:hypothetical protein